MPSVEKKIINFFLKQIRSRRAKQEAGTSPELPVTGRVSVREAQFADFGQVSALNTKLGQGQDSLANWKRLWQDNPALTQTGTTGVIGWVLEASDKIVGFMGSIPVLYEYDRKTLFGVVASRLAVEPAYRAFSHLLIVSFFRQKNVDIFLNTTATVSAGKMMLAFKAAPLPQRDYGTVLFWVIDSRQFAKSVLRRIEIAPALTGAASLLLSIAVAGDTSARGRKPRAKPGNYIVRETAITELSSDFERFLADKSQEAAILLAKRTAAIMRWHFEPPDSTRVARVLSCYAGDRLVGYGIVRHDSPAGDGLRRSVVADLLIEKDDPQIGALLLAAIYKSAKNFGSHVLEAMGFPQRIKQIFMTCKPYSRKYPADPFFYRASDRVLHEKLADERMWYACPFDGDGTLMP